MARDRHAIGSSAVSFPNSQSIIYPFLRKQNEGVTYYNPYTKHWSLYINLDTVPHLQVGGLLSANEFKIVVPFFVSLVGQELLGQYMNSVPRFCEWERTVDLTISGDAVISISVDTPGAIVQFVLLVLNVVANSHLEITVVLIGVNSKGWNE